MRSIVNKAASLGLVVGETRNGKNHFRPRDSVSLSESCQLAYKLLIQTGKAKADDSVTQKWTPIMNAYGIQSWAYPAVSYCLENGILATSNLSGFMKNGSNLPATREQAATILGRALTKGVSSYTANETTTTFILFERFLNPERVSMPDIDSDFCYERRQEVIDYVGFQ